ncbi:hypothetical protein GXY_14912 [Novacetimonas hansenii ATCC 23769]|uniref:Uncharacterized protein n=1 Tax=Novacetimonas hansenii ATCC 23769 TaxID=714995 RepID=D5QIK1_NOVHA|nr:hypothetical protein GXY_14912 [Novacetimonas hansenii ATCC 23769]
MDMGQGPCLSLRVACPFVPMSPWLKSLTENE